MGGERLYEASREGKAALRFEGGWKSFLIQWVLRSFSLIPPAAINNEPARIRGLTGILMCNDEATFGPLARVKPFQTRVITSAGKGVQNWPNITRGRFTVVTGVGTRRQLPPDSRRSVGSLPTNMIPDSGICSDRYLKINRLQ